MLRLKDAEEKQNEGNKFRVKIGGTVRDPLPPNFFSSKDPNQIAAGILAAVTGEAEAQPTKNPSVVALGRLSGLKGGKARAGRNCNAGRLKNNKSPY